MFTAKNHLKKVVIEAVVTRADGNTENLGKVCEIKQPKWELFDKFVNFIKTGRGE